MLIWGAAGAIGLALPATIGSFSIARAADSALVAAASDLRFVLPELVRLFETQTGSAEGAGIKIAFGSSGNLSRQIAQGGPFELFLAADETYTAMLSERGLTEDAGFAYAAGRVAIFVPQSSKLKPDGSLADLTAAIADGRLKRFAIANPEHAPYGMRAQEALAHQGILQAIRPFLVLGENVAQAAQFAASGAADGGLIAHALALAPELRQRGASALVPAEWHSPLIQRMVLMASAGATARAFYRFLQGAEARAVLERYGFSLPAN